MFDAGKNCWYYYCEVKCVKTTQEQVVYIKSNTNAWMEIENTREKGSMFLLQEKRIRFKMIQNLNKN